MGLFGQWQAWFAQHPLVFALVIVWAFLWKGLALWHSARGSQPVWFFFLLIINTLGILEILYLLFFRRRRRVF
ncbi:MAG: hypothetical protein HPY50_00905 [Firmicutes bacterium]|nr:hypothetical protein [Bacillota bacterium]